MPVSGAHDDDEGLAVFRHKLGISLGGLLGDGRKTLFGCLELVGDHDKNLPYSVLSVQKL